MGFYMTAAGLCFRVYAHHNSIYDLLSDYSIEPKELTSNVIDIEITQDEVDMVENEYQIDPLQKEMVHIFKDPVLLEYQAIQRQIARKILVMNAFVIHGSVISTEGYGYMFIGPSGIGKSTRTRVWMDAFPGSVVVNGDKPFVRILDNAAYAFGSPWCGKEGWNTNISVPLKAIFVVVRNEKNADIAIHELSYSEAVMALMGSSYIPGEHNAIHELIKLQKTICKSLRVFRLRSNPSRDAMKLAYKTANELSVSFAAPNG